MEMGPRQCEREPGHRSAEILHGKISEAEGGGVSVTFGVRRRVESFYLPLRMPRMPAVREGSINDVKKVACDGDLDRKQKLMCE